MASNGEFITVAVRAGILVDITEVESGFACGCKCPACDEALVAKKGAKAYWLHNTKASERRCQHYGFPEVGDHQVYKRFPEYYSYFPLLPLPPQ